MEELIEKLVDEIGLAADNGLNSSALEKIVRSYHEEKNKIIAGHENQDRNDSGDHASSENTNAVPVIVDESLLLSVFDQLSQHPNVDVHPDETQPDNPSPLRSIFTATEEQVWKSLTGHGIDKARVPISQWELLIVIAAAGPAGVLQPETTRVTGQDKRSVPMRTDRLAENGYIDKEAVSAAGQRTSLLRLRRWRGVQVAAKNETNETGKRPMVFYSSWFDDTIRLLKENGGIRTMDDLRTGVGIVAKHRETKIYLRAIHRLADAGCIRRLTARVLDAEGNEVSMRTGPPRTARAVQLLREPTSKDRAIWIKHGNTKGKHDSDSDDEDNPQAFGEGSAAVDGDAAGSAAFLSSTRPTIKRRRRARKKAAQRAAKRSGGPKSRQAAESDEEEDLELEDEDVDEDADAEATVPAAETVAATRQKRTSSKRMSYQLPAIADHDSEPASDDNAAGSQDLPSTTSPKRARKKTVKAVEYETALAAREHARPRRVSNANAVQEDDDDIPANTNPFISITDDALEFTPLDANGNIGPSLGADWKLESTSTPRGGNHQLGKKRGPYKKRDPDAVPKARKRVEIPPEEFAEFEKFAQLTAERKVRAEIRSSRKRNAAEAQLDAESQRPEKTPRLEAAVNDGSESIPAEDLPADRVAALKESILAREQAGVYINPPGARNLKLESFISRGRPRNTLIAVVKSERLHELDLFKPGDGLPRFAPKASQRRTARIGIAAGLALPVSDFFVDGSDSEGEKGTPTPAGNSAPVLSSDVIDADAAPRPAKKLKKGPAEHASGLASGMGRFRLLPSGAGFVNPAFIPPASRKASDQLASALLPASNIGDAALTASESVSSAAAGEASASVDKEPSIGQSGVPASTLPGRVSMGFQARETVPAAPSESLHGAASAAGDAVAAHAGPLITTPNPGGVQPSTTIVPSGSAQLQARSGSKKDILEQRYLSPATRLTAINAAVNTMQKKRGRRPEKDHIRLQVLLRHQQISQQASSNVGPGAAEELQYLLHEKDGISEEELARVKLLRQHLEAAGQNGDVQTGSAQPTTSAEAPVAHGATVPSSGTPSLTGELPVLHEQTNADARTSQPKPWATRPSFKVKLTPSHVAAETNEQPDQSDPEQVAESSDNTQKAAKIRHYQGPKPKDVESPTAESMPPSSTRVVSAETELNSAQPAVSIDSPNIATTPASSELPAAAQTPKTASEEPVPTFDQSYVLAHKGEQFYHRGHGRYSRGVKPVKPAAEKKKQNPASTPRSKANKGSGRRPSATPSTSTVQTPQATQDRETSAPAIPVQGQAGYQPPKTFNRAYVNAHPDQKFYHRGGGRYCLGEKPSRLAAYVPRKPVSQTANALTGLTASNAASSSKLTAVPTTEGQTDPQASSTQAPVEKASDSVSTTLANAGPAALIQSTSVPEPDATAGAADDALPAQSEPAASVETSVSGPENDSSTTDGAADATRIINGITGLTQPKPAPKRIRTSAADAVPTFTYDYVLAHPDEIFHNRGHGNYARGPHPTNAAYNAYRGKKSDSAANSSPARSATPRSPSAARPAATTNPASEALFTSNYVNSHPEETFHHRGGGKWARGLPPANAAIKCAVRGPGTKDYQFGLQPSTPPARRSSAVGRQATTDMYAFNSGSASPQLAAAPSPTVQISPLLNIFRPYSHVATVSAPEQQPKVGAGTEAQAYHATATVAKTTAVRSGDGNVAVLAASAPHEHATAGAEIEDEMDADADGEVDDDMFNSEVAHADNNMDIEWTPVAEAEDIPMDDDDDWDDTPKRRRGPRNPRVAGFNPELDFPLDEAVVVRSSLVASILPVGENSVAAPKRIFAKKPIVARKSSNTSSRVRQESSSDDSDSDVSPEQAKLQGTMQIANYRHDLSDAMKPKTDKSRISRRMRFEEPRRQIWSTSMSALVEVYGKEESRQHSSLLMHPAQFFHESSGTFGTAGDIVPPSKTLEDEFRELEGNPSTPRTRIRKSKTIVPPAQRLLVKLKIPSLGTLDLNFDGPASPTSSELQGGSPATLAGNQTLGGTKRPYHWRPKQVSFQTPLDDADNDSTFIEDDAPLEVSEEDFSDDDALSDASEPGRITDRVRKKQTKLPSGEIRKRDRQSGALFKDSDRLVVAFSLVAALCGGINQDRINWNLIAHALSFRYDGEFLRRRWVQIRRTRLDEVSRLRDAIHEPFLQAYENNQLPRIDFANLVNTDWPALFDWAFENVAPTVSPNAFSSPQTHVPKNPDLPATRAALIESFQIEVADQPYQLHLDEYFTATTDIARKYLATNFHYGVPLIRQPKAGDEATDNLLLLKSWVRAVAVTRQRYYNAEAAAKKLRLFNPNLLQKVTTWMIENRFFAQERKGRHLPGRNFQVHNDVLSQFRRWPARPDESRFLRFVAQAWSTISRHFDYNTSLNLIPAATDPEYLVLTNMVASGLVRVKTLLPEPNDDFDAPFPRLSPWGYCGDSYETKKVDMARLKFPLVYEKTPNFSPHHGLRTNVPIPLFPPIPFPGEQSLGPRIPFWVDIHGNLIHDVWDMVLRSILHLLVFRPGVTSKGMAEFHGHKLWEWEILLALGWLEKTGVAVRTNGCGWRAGVFWFCLFSKEVAVWEGPEV